MRDIILLCLHCRVQETCANDIITVEGSFYYAVAGKCRYTLTPAARHVCQLCTRAVMYRRGIFFFLSESKCWTIIENQEEEKPAFL